MDDAEPSNISSTIINVLPDLPTSIVNIVLETLQSLGVENPEDFQYIQETSQVTYVTMVPRMGNETLRPLGVATGNALSVTRV